MNRIAGALAALVCAAPGVAAAQSYQCNIPERIAPPHAEGPTQGQPRRVLPIGGYTLAISWSPQQCAHRSDISSSFQCDPENRFGFTLHGLWPDGKRENQWPQYCKAAPVLPQTVIRRHICTTPSAQLLQHEYAKHGTCTGMTPTTYFATSARLFGNLRYPDMAALSRKRDLTAGQLARAIAAANPGITTRMMRLTADKRGWLQEVWLCLDTRLRYRACPAFEKSLPDDQPIRIRRPADR
ncbi:ribonuclease T2 family protein [Stakelama pacifica]|uniref:Ribonuclease T2 n=1 Tax=Stakelama pacifica TaxID=517720 RepID=A0A4R6FH22_9SPHN|nr:ribonuclease T [Stakelama pacifica]TDN80632.1 ribonuclease T2 [Stakelama pacifica]GGO97592.1 ribonuclease T(2) [Stakelama pacifica]